MGGFGINQLGDTFGMRSYQICIIHLVFLSYCFELRERKLQLVVSSILWKFAS